MNPVVATPVSSSRESAGQRLRNRVVQALGRLLPTHHVLVPPSEVVKSERYLSQSSAPPVDLSLLWAAEGDRIATYRDADLMDAESDLASAALNAWASTATSGSLFTPDRGDDGQALGVSVVQGIQAQAGGGLLYVKASTPAAQEIVDQIMYDCKLAERAWSIARDLRKYGDKFMEVVVDDKMTIRRVKSLPAAEMIRDEDDYGRLLPVAFRQQRNGITCAQFAAWQVVHIRNNPQGDEKYGRSGLRTARRIWRMLSLLEDSLVSARLTRAYQKLVHFLPVTDDSTQAERASMVQEYIRTMTTSNLIDPTTGRIEQRPNPISVATDFYMTVSPSDSPKTGIVSLDPSNQQISHIQDLEYFQNLMVSGLEVPKAFLGLERDVNAKATLGYQEIHFLRQAGSLQNFLNEGIQQVMELGMTLAGIDPTDVELCFEYGGTG